METVEVMLIQKNDTEQIRVAIREYKDRYYLDLRLFFIPNYNEDHGVMEYVPSKKGLTVPIEMLPEILTGLEEAEKVMKRIAVNV